MMEGSATLANGDASRKPKEGYEDMNLTISGILYYGDRHRGGRGL